MRLAQLISSKRRLSAAMAVALSGASLAVVECGDSSTRPSGDSRPRASEEERVRAVAKAVLQAYADEDYRRLCAQYAPGTFTELLAVTKIDSCEDLFGNASTFEMPSPQQVNDAEVRIRGDHAKLMFRIKGVDDTLLKKVRGRWLIADKAELTSPSSRRAAAPRT